MNEVIRYKLEMRLIRYDNQSPDGRPVSELGVKRETVKDLFTQEVWEAMGKAFVNGPTA